MLTVKIDTYLPSTRVRARVNNETTHRHAALSLLIRWLPSAMPRKAKPEARTRTYTIDEPPAMFQ
jgi:hypothetical protein